MATAKRLGARTRQPSHWLRNLILLVLLVALAAGAFFWARMRVGATARSAVAAESGCICRYVSGRSLSACQGDPGVAQKWVHLSDDPDAYAVTGSVWALSQQTARWTPESGCMLDPWRP